MFEIVVALVATGSAALTTWYIRRYRRQAAELARLREEVATATAMVVVLAEGQAPQAGPSVPRQRRRGHLRLIKGGLVAAVGAVVGWLVAQRREVAIGAATAAAGALVGLQLEPGTNPEPPPAPRPARPAEPPLAAPPASMPPEHPAALLDPPAVTPVPGGTIPAGEPPPAAPTPATSPVVVPLPTPTPGQPEPEEGRECLTLDLPALPPVELLCVRPTS